MERSNGRTAVTPPVQANALAALERARQAQEAHERRIDVQLRFWSVQEQLDAELADTVQAVRAERAGLR
jgi:hypothetical protein